MAATTGRPHLRVSGLANRQSPIASCGFPANCKLQTVNFSVPAVVSETEDYQFRLL